MSQALKPMDAFFLLAETRRAPWHAAGCEIFEKPAGQGDEFVAKLLRDLHKQEATFPFNVALDQQGMWPRWKEVEVDLSYHVQHQVLPAPATERELMAAMEHFYASTLDRNMPLWECCIFDNLEGNRFALAFKMHHALTDGQGGLKLILNALSLRKRDRKARALWSENSDNDTFGRKPAKGARNTAAGKGRPLKMLGEMGKQTSRLLKSMKSGRLRDLRLFRAPHSVMNQQAQSSARRFGIGELSLSLMKRVGRANGASINDVLLYAVDAGLHRYLQEMNREVPGALVCAMPVSVRGEDSEARGNQAGMLAVELGLPGDNSQARLARIKASTARAKDNIRQLPNSFLMAYGLTVLGAPLLLDQVSNRSKASPIVNLAVSNVSPPAGSNYLGKPLYLRGARLTGLYTQPILAPSVLLNVTAASFEDKMCLGIGSTREAIADPMLLATYAVEALEQLAGESGVGNVPEFMQGV